MSYVSKCVMSLEDKIIKMLTFVAASQKRLERKPLSILEEVITSSELVKTIFQIIAFVERFYKFRISNILLLL